MTTVDLNEAASGLPRLLKLLESKEEDVIYIACGENRLQLTLAPKNDTSARIGVAAGKFTVPDDFDAWDNEIGEMFEDSEL